MSLPILQEQGGALSGLLRGIGMGVQQSVPAISEMIMSHQKQKQQKQLLESILGPQSRPMSSQFDQQLGMGEMPQASSLEITPDKIVALEAAGEHNMANSLSRIYQGQEKERMQKQKKSEETKIGQEAFNRQVELLNTGKLGFGSKQKGYLQGGDIAETVGEFESLNGALESMLVDRVSRGTLSNARFKYITETLLPKATDREATIKGKMKALARELGLDPSALTVKGSMQKVRMVDSEGNAYDIPSNKVAQAEQQGFKKS